MLDKALSKYFNFISRLNSGVSITFGAWGKEIRVCGVN